MTMFPEAGILDANVLAYATNADVVHHAASRTLIDAARRPRGEALRNVAGALQVLFDHHEPAPCGRAILISRSLSDYFGAVVLAGYPGSPNTGWAVRRWMELLQRHPVTGGDVFDLQLVATMQAKNVQRMYTFNAADFEIFPELIVVVPRA